MKESVGLSSQHNVITGESTPVFLRAEGRRAVWDIQIDHSEEMKEKRDVTLLRHAGPTFEKRLA